MKVEINILFVFATFPQVKEANLSNYCECAGRFQTTIPVGDFVHHMLTFRNIARYDMRNVN